MADTTTSPAPKVVEINCTTGETIERDMTADEIAAQQKSQADFAAQQAAKEAADAAKAAAKQSATDKLTKLGLTADEIAAIVG